MLNRRLRHVITVVDHFLIARHAPPKANIARPVVIKIGHCARVCRSTKSRFPARHTVQNIHAPLSDEEEEAYIYSVKPAQSQTQHALHVKLPLCQVYVNNQPVDMLIDSGASVNIIDSQTFGRISKESFVNL